MAYPSYLPFMQLAVSADARKRYWIARNRYGGEENIRLLDQVVAGGQQKTAAVGPTLADRREPQEEASELAEDGEGS